MIMPTTRSMPENMDKTTACTMIMLNDTNPKRKELKEGIYPLQLLDNIHKQANSQIEYSILLSSFHLTSVTPGGAAVVWLVWESWR